jgi:hypothetical protein
MIKQASTCIATYLYSHTRHLFLAESVLVADTEQEVSCTEGRLSRGESTPKRFAPVILPVTISGMVWVATDELVP